MKLTESCMLMLRVFAFRTEHSVADDVPVDLFQQGCIRLFGFMRQYLLELGEHPFA